MYCWASGVILPTSGISDESSLFPSDVGCLGSDFLLDIFSFNNVSSPTIESSGFCLPMFPSYISRFFSRQSLYSAFRSVYLQNYNGLRLMQHLLIQVESRMSNRSNSSFFFLLSCNNSPFLIIPLPPSQQNYEHHIKLPCPFGGNSFLKENIFYNKVSKHRECYIFQEIPHIKHTQIIVHMRKTKKNQYKIELCLVFIHQCDANL